MKVLITILFSIMLTSCPDKTQQNSQDDNSFVSLYKGRMNGAGDMKQQNKVVKSEKEWKRLLSQLTISQTNLPEIDFSKNTLLVLIDKVRNTGGFSVEVENVKTENDKLIVVVKHTGPKPTDMVTMAIEQPFQVIKINKTNKEIVFVTK